jgi:hypothetical protein
MAETWKISKLFKCQCRWIHIAQGPCSCWVCGDSISFEQWQTGKVPKVLARPRHKGKPLEVDPTRRLYPEDPRNVRKDVWALGPWGPEITDPGYNACFGDREDKFGLDVLMRFELDPSPAPHVIGYKVINKQFGL